MKTSSMIEDEREWYEERAAIIQYEAGETRENADRIAGRMMRQKRDDNNEQD